MFCRMKFVSDFEIISLNFVVMSKSRGYGPVTQFAQLIDHSRAMVTQYNSGQNSLRPTLQPCFNKWYIYSMPSPFTSLFEISWSSPITLDIFIN